MNTSSRFSIIDSLRGLAVTMMIVFHFCYDLTYFEFTKFDFYHDPFWLNFRSIIVSLFLVVVGISLTLVNTHALAKNRVIRRLVILFLCSLLITVVSYFLFPGRTIVFGIIHFITIASIFSLAFVQWPLLSGLLGVSLIYIGNNVSNVFFNQSALHWLGMMTYRPNTEDYVPLLPWLGVVLCGISIGWLLTNTTIGKNILSLEINIIGIEIFRWLGRNSLLVYMLHQVILFALFSLFIMLL